MRMGIDARALHGQRTGIGNWTWHLLRRLPGYIPDLELFAYLPAGLSCDVPQEFSTVRFRSSGALPLLSGHFWVKFGSNHLVKRDALDVYLAPRTLYPHGIEKWVPVVTVVHDLNVFVQPKTMSQTNYIAHRLWFRHDIRRAQAVICNSYATSTRLSTIIGRPADAVVHPGVKTDLALRANGHINASSYVNKVPYLLYIGTLEPRKNLETMLEAHRQLNSSRSHKISLLLVGKRGWKSGRLYKQLDQGIENVYEIGYTSDNNLHALYKNALALVLPSYYEGFGMPAAEARAYGIHAVVTDIPELREATCNQGIYVAPTVDGILKGVEIAINTAPPPPSNPFPWGRSAEILADTLKSVCRHADAATVVRRPH